MDYLGLECFLAVASTGSFTKAASKINRTQSAVSQQIAKLEGLLGKTLIERKNKLALTENGEIFQQYAQKILAIHAEIIARFKDPSLEGEVTFGVPEDFASLFLTDVLVEFGRVHPKVLMHVECDLTLNLYERFKKNEFDMVLVKMSAPKDFPNGVEVLSEELTWVGDKKLLLSHFDEGQPLPLVLAPSPCVYRSRVINSLEQASVNWNVVFSSPSYNGTVAAIKAGLGIGVFPKLMVPKGLEVIKSPLLPPLEDTHISLLKQERASPAILQFEEFILKKLMP